MSVKGCVSVATESHASLDTQVARPHALLVPALKPRAHKHTTPRRPGAALRRAIFARDPDRCVYCMAKGGEVDLTIDHVIAWAAGGETVAGNLVVCCKPCNDRKAAWPVHFYAMLLESEKRGTTHKILLRLYTWLARPLSE